MPAFSTHYIFAKEMMNEIKGLATDFNLDENAVYIGAQGPDIFFFHRVFPWWIGKSKRKIGSALHRSKIGDMLDEMQVYCEKSSEKDIAKSYAFGFILHYALDSMCHPFVYSLQEKMVEKSKGMNPHTAHNIVELSIDSLMLNRELGIEKPTLFDTSKTFNFTEKEKAEIAKEIVSLAKKVGINDLSETDVKTAIEDTKGAQKALTDTSGNRLKMVKGLDVISGAVAKNYKLSALFRPIDLETTKKYVNINNGKWESPFESGIRNESFYDLFSLAKINAKKMISDFQNGISGYEITHNLSFLTGVEVK